MAEANLRRILAAFAEKNWVVYETDESRVGWDAFDGPVDNLRYGVSYRVLPAAENPADLKAAAQELNDAVCHDGTLPALRMPDGNAVDIVDIGWFIITPSHFIVDPSRETRREFPIAEVEGLIRDYFATYDREYTRKRVEDELRREEAMKERRRQRRRQADDECLRIWFDSIVGGQDEQS